MRGSRLLWRLYAGYAVIILGTAVFLGLVIGRHVIERQNRLVHRMLRTNAMLLGEIARPVLSHPVTKPDSSLQHRVRVLGESGRVRYTIISSDGRVLADSRRNPAGMPNHGRRPEILQALARKYGTATRYSESVGEPMVYEAMRVGAADRPEGFVRAALPRRVVLAAASNVRTILYGGIAAGVLIALVVGWIFARSVTYPIGQITRAARDITRGAAPDAFHTDRRDEIGDLVRAFHAMTSELHRHIATSTAEHNKTAAILAGMVEGVIAVDREERVVRANASACSILGIDPGLATGRPIWEVTRVTEASDAVRTALDDEKMCIAEARIATPGAQQVVQMTATPLKSAAGVLDGVILVLHDVSELRRLESVRRDFIANVSHELKTPLTAIRGLVETLIEDDAMDSRTHARFLSRVEEQTHRLSNLVGDLLTISRLEADGGRTQLEPADLRATIVDSCRALAGEAEARGVHLETNVSGTIPRVRGDAEALRELADNLIGNAIKYTPEGGCVGVDLRVEGSVAALEVRDTGIGIAPEHQGRIFERFYRVDRARSREMGGTGLGLSIVKHVALAHGGNVSLRSAPGAGSTFRVEIPVPPGSDERRNTDAGSAPGSDDRAL